jgi:hypothetical protein
MLRVTLSCMPEFLGERMRRRFVLNQRIAVRPVRMWHLSLVFACLAPWRGLADDHIACYTTRQAAASTCAARVAITGRIVRPCMVCHGINWG